MLKHLRVWWWSRRVRKCLGRAPHPEELVDKLIELGELKPEDRAGAIQAFHSKLVADAFLAYGEAITGKKLR